MEAATRTAPISQGYSLHKVRRATVGFIVFSVSSSYLLLSGLRGPRPEMELYALLARSFLQGTTALPIDPRPALLALPDPYDPYLNQPYRLEDASLYRGHYYLYFGVVPAVALFLPYRLVTGQDLPNRIAVPIFCIGGYLCSCALFFLLARHNRWTLPLWLECAIVLSLGSMSLVSLLLPTPAFYQVAISAGYCCVMAGFLVLAKGLVRSLSPRKWLLFSGVLFGLAVGCRPHLVIVCVIVLGTFAIRARQNPTLVLAMAAGMAACALGLGWYNYARFHDPLEFGRTYQLTVFPRNPLRNYRGLELNPSGTLRSAKQFLLVTPQAKREPPFFYTTPTNPLVGRAGKPFWMEDMVGLIPAAPWALLGLFAPVFLAKKRFAALLDEASHWLLQVMYWSGVLILCLLCLVGWVLGRYLVDFAGLLTFEGASLIALFWQRIPGQPRRHIFAGAVGLTAIYGAVLNAALATPPLDLILYFFRRRF
ncbi:MAG: hypothetical protein WBW69_08560 [Candidatus Korobacteraceae bacterium]